MEGRDVERETGSRRRRARAARHPASRILLLLLPVILAAPQRPLAEPSGGARDGEHMLVLMPIGGPVCTSLHLFPADDLTVAGEFVSFGGGRHQLPAVQLPGGMLTVIDSLTDPLFAGTDIRALQGYLVIRFAPGQQGDLAAAAAGPFDGLAGDCEGRWSIVEGVGPFEASPGSKPMARVASGPDLGAQPATQWRAVWDPEAPLPDLNLIGSDVTDRVVYGVRLFDREGNDAGGGGLFLFGLLTRLSPASFARKGATPASVRLESDVPAFITLTDDPDDSPATLLDRLDVHDERQRGPIRLPIPPDLGGGRYGAVVGSADGGDFTASVRNAAGEVVDRHVESIGANATATIDLTATTAGLAGGGTVSINAGETTLSSVLVRLSDVGFRGARRAATGVVIPGLRDPAAIRRAVILGVDGSGGSVLDAGVINAGRRRVRGIATLRRADGGVVSRRRFKLRRNASTRLSFAPPGDTDVYVEIVVSGNRARPISIFALQRATDGSGVTFLPSRPLE